MFAGPAVERLNSCPATKILVTDSIPARSSVPERLEYVKAPAPTRRGAVAVFCDAGTGPRGDKGRRGGDIESLLTISPGPTRVDRVLGDECGAHTFPYLEVKNASATVEHEATTSKIGEDQIFYCKQRGLETEDAVSMIVNGFCKEVFNELPMEFAVEAQKLLSISLEGAVG